MELYEFQMHLINQYCNTPILDKIDSCKELPKNVKDWVVFDAELNLKYALKIRKNIDKINQNNRLMTCKSDK